MTSRRNDRLARASGQPDGGMPLTTELARAMRDRIGAAESLPDLLAAAFDAFELIRLTARACELADPGLFAAFMATANSAVDGREALLAAPSLPTDPMTALAEPSVTETGTADLAALGRVLAERLARAAGPADEPGDQEACLRAAEAAGRVRAFMAGDGDDGLW